MGATSGSDDDDRERPSVESTDLGEKKLRAEIEEIRLRIENQRRSGGSRFSSSLKYLGIMVPLAAAVVGAVVEWGRFQDSRERLARFEVGSEVVDLVTRLDDSTDERGQVLAAHQLAWFGRPTAPLLFEQLVQEDSHSVRSAIAQALRRIAAEDDTSPSAVAEITDATVDFVVYACRRDTVMVRRIDDRLRALDDLVVATRSVQPIGSDERQRLTDLRTTLEAATCIEPEDRTRMLAHLDRLIAGEV